MECLRYALNLPAAVVITGVDSIEMSIFDGTAQNPAWLGDEPQRLQNLMP